MPKEKKLRCSHCARYVNASDRSVHARNLHPGVEVTFSIQPKRKSKTRPKKEVPGQSAMFDAEPETPKPKYD